MLENACPLPPARNAWRRWSASLALAATATLVPGLCVAAPHSMAYVAQVNIWYLAWIVDWQSSQRAHVVNFAGNADGSWTQDPATGQRLVTLDTPVVYMQQVPDCTGTGTFTQRVDLLQLAITEDPGTRRKGSAAVVEIGQFVDLGGCTPGKVTPVGSPSDPGIASDRLEMDARPSMADLVPGARIAGFSETPYIHPLADGLLAQDVVTFGEGSVAFAGSGHVDATSSQDGWIVVDLGTERRAYSRFRADAHGEEDWLVASWSADGTPQNVWRVFMVKPRDGASFGGPARAAHVWESGLFAGSNNPTWYDLYRDGTGLRVQEDLAAGTRIEVPVTAWWLSGDDLVQQRAVGTGVGERTWKPVATVGRRHWVLENEVQVAPDGTRATSLPQRVNSYFDEGPARPATAQAK